MTRWEYLILVWRESMTGEVQAPSYERHLSITRSRDRRVQRVHAEKPFMEVMHELGAEGWELVGESVTSSALFEGHDGFPAASVAVGRRWTFKRPVE
jgi:hypothetical protein